MPLCCCCCCCWRNPLPPAAPPWYLCGDTGSVGGEGPASSLYLSTMLHGVMVHLATSKNWYVPFSSDAVRNSGETPGQRASHTFETCRARMRS